MKNALNLYYFCIYFKKRPKNDLALFRFVLYTPQGLKTYQSCRRSFQVNSFRVLADSVYKETVLLLIQLSIYQQQVNLLSINCSYDSQVCPLPTLFLRFTVQCSQYNANAFSAKTLYLLCPQNCWLCSVTCYFIKILEGLRCDRM